MIEFKLIYSVNYLQSKSFRSCFEMIFFNAEALSRKELFLEID